MTDTDAHAPTDTTAPAWDRLVDAVRRYVRRRVRCATTAEDLAQDVFVKLADHLHRGAIRGPLHAWLFRAARTTVVDHLRARHPTAVGDDDLTADVASPAAELEAAPLFASCRAFVAALPPEQRDALLRTEYDGLSQKALADELGVAPSTVKSRVQRGRKRLERALRACCTFELDRRGNVVDWQRRPGGSGCTDC